LPSSKKIEEYRNLLIETYKDLNNHDKLTEDALKDALCNYFVEASTKNTYINDIRSARIHITSKFLIASFIFGSVSYVPFYINNYYVENVNKLNSPQVHTKGREAILKEEQKRPPQRLVKEGVEIKKPKRIKPTEIRKEK
jgi:hypothetical protein